MAYELENLIEAGFTYDVDAVAQEQGVFRVMVRGQIAGDTRELVVTYPDLYPYFRFEIAAPNETLPYHQNVRQKNLCVLGRATEHWHTTDTLASILEEQVPRVFMAARSHIATASEIEEHQAEPVSVYYPCDPQSLILVHGDWELDAQLPSGSLLVRLMEGGRSDLSVRGIVVELRSNANKVIARADPRAAAAFTGEELRGRWLRLNTRPETDANFKPRPALIGRPELAQSPANRFAGGTLRIFGFVFSEDVAYRTTGDGWLFACEYARRANPPNRTDGRGLWLNKPQRR